MCLTRKKGGGEVKKKTNKGHQTGFRAEQYASLKMQQKCARARANKLLNHTIKKIVNELEEKPKPEARAA